MSGLEGSGHLQGPCLGDGEGQPAGRSSSLPSLGGWGPIPTPPLHLFLYSYFSRELL